MHAPLPFHITVCRFGACRIACWLLVVAAFSVTALWVRAAFNTHLQWAAVSTLIFTLTVSAGLLVAALRLRPIGLRWDGQVWHLRLADSAKEEAKAGRLQVALDLGSWMLLRFVEQGTGRGTWWPVQRRGHEHGWHALRATVYCARPVSLPTAAPF